MTDDFERRLRESLHDAVAERGYRPDRATFARQRARRTRHTMWTSAVAVVAVVVAAVVVPTVLVNAGGPQHPTTASQSATGAGPTPATPASPQATATAPAARPSALPNQCPKNATTTPSPEGAVPTGADRAYVCPASPTSGLVPPVDALSTDLGYLTHLVNTLPKTSSHQKCSTERGPAYMIVFHYPDQQTVSVRGDLAGCRVVHVGTTDRGGAKRLLQVYTMALLGQRAHTTPPARVGDIPPVLSCPRDVADAPRSILQFAFGQVFASPHRTFQVPLARAEICQLPGTTGRTRSGVLTAEQVHKVNTDLATHVSGRPVRGWTCLGPVGPRVLVALTSWGDPMMWPSTQCGQAYQLAKGVIWRPGRSVEKMLESILDG